MFDRILVPVDGSPRGVEAAEAARHLAERFAAQVVLLRVEGSLAPLGQVLADNRALEQQVNDLRKHGLRADYTIGFGRPDKAIADRAQTERAQLIVMAPHQRSRIAALRHPSVTARMLGHAPAPLLVWPEQEPDRACANFLHMAGSLILAPLDGSALAEHALPYAVGFAQTYARALLLVRVVPSPVVTGDGPAIHRGELAYQSQAEREAHHYLSATRRRLSQQHPGLHIQSMILSGEPWRALLRCTETHDGGLVVMTTRGRGGLRRALLGSVAARLVRHTTLPLLIVPPGDAADGAMEAEEADGAALHASWPRFSVW